MVQIAARLVPYSVWLLPAAASLVGLAIMSSNRTIALVGVAAGITLIILTLIIQILARQLAVQRADDLAQIARVAGQDPDAIFVTDLSGVVTYRNGAAARQFSGGGSDLVTAVGSQVATPEKLLKTLAEQARAAGSARREVKLRRGHLDMTVHGIGRDRLFWRMVGQADPGQAAHHGDSIGLPMLTASRAGTILFMNDALRRLLGGRRTTLDGVIADLPIRPGDAHDIICTDGALRAKVIALGTDARQELYFVPVDTAELMADRPFLDALPVPLLKIDPDGDVLHANRPARDLLALPEVPPDGASLAMKTLVEGLGRPVAEWLADAASGRGLGRPEVVRATRPETETYLQISLGRIEGRDGAALVAVLHDATELKTLEAQFVQSQKMEAIGQLAGGIAHDFNNLLTAILGHCDLLLLRHDSGDPEYDDLMQITENANRAGALVSQLLAFSRKQTLTPEHLDLRDTLSDLTHLLNRLVGEKVTFSLTHETGLKLVRADKRQIEQVMMNLVVNARDAMRDGGVIRVETAMVTLAEVLERDRAKVPPGEYVVLRVIDTGVGIAPDKVAKIFEPFYTTKRVGEGTGLGLSTVYGIVKQSGGYIFADSTLGEGSCFTLYLPAHEHGDVESSKATDSQDTPAPRVIQMAAPPVPMSASPSGEPAPAAAPDGSKPVVLLVEDEAPVRAFASRALRMRGYHVIEAESAEDALEKLEDAALNVDVFVTDVVMPGMDGPGWVARALEQRPGTRVVFVSGYTEESLADRSADIPNAVFLAKPFSLTELTKTVRRQLS